MPSANDGPSFTTSKTSQNTTSENVHFVDGDTPWTYDVAATPDETSKLSGFDDAGLGEFLSRPIKIQQYQWTPGVQLFQTFNPWSDYFGNADVLEKINRFRNLRCKLCLKVLINGNSFYYGRALLSYNPYLRNDQVTVNRSFFIQDLIAASNKPHILLDPCSSEGGQMCLPFIWPENYLDITSTGWEDQMGECIIHDFDVLRHANGGTDPITVSIFAWAEDVSLLIPTTVAAQSDFTTSIELDEFGFPKPFELQAQTKSKKKAPKKSTNTTKDDEFKHDGLISKPASAVAKAADALSMIPYIAPYAKATSMVADKIGKIARIFGYSRPAVLSDIQPYVPRYCGNLANSDAPETVNKLSVDSKNELTIDTRTMGLGGADELTIHSIASRMTFWRQFDWPESAVTDTLLASMSVQPFCIDTVTASPVTEIHSTALAFASAPFETWQGSIKFHFKVVCSEYHRGRLRLVYNPLTNNAGPVAFNQVYSTTIDISNDREFDYECKWTDIRAWNACIGIDGATSATFFNTAAAVTGGTPFDNGTLSVYVVNELATPSTAAADVKVQVWVSAGDDFAVAVPGVGLSQLSYFQQQATMESADSDPVLAKVEDNSNNPVGGNPIDNYGTEHAPLLKEDNQYLVYQGERIVSFKDLLRRYQYLNSYWPQETGSGFRYYTLDSPGMPIYRGWDPNGIDQGQDSTAGNSPYNFCSMTLLNYLAPAFVCQRGSLRHKWVTAGARVNSTASVLSATRHGVLFPLPLAETAHPLDNALVGDRRSELQEMQRSRLNGTAITPVRLNNTLEIELPYYSIGQRFHASRFLDLAGTGDTQGVEIACEISDGGNDANYRLDQFVSVGEDFTLGMFVGAPIMYFYNDPTAT
ncbi:predicted structural protein [Chaetoceros tenuissimus RNA virus type II]|uniref:Predicted structural protein n=5 Tax=Chaetoceros tenuissimus RNA virus type II TaxID=1516128 RepID=A0A0B6VJB4_9VIRU|nr:predicted structural protein [Chaetoceros tenuissimus RNA virus type II]BAP99819.1 predicted structural protein [Chaetoceros tenuissimus RNA virus type II]